MSNSSELSPPTRRELAALLPQVGVRDEHRLRRRLDQARSPEAVAVVARQIQQAQEWVAGRAAAVPKIEYPEGLPVSARADDIAAAIAENQVVIVAGETGSGKTTQLPKICLALGRGQRGLIGHTQPRRLAARTVAARIADELGVELGGVVGFSVRFTDHVSDKTLVKLMTDGILLAEIGRDRLLRQYDTLIIDEAHERSLNIDFILGYLKTLLPQRPDLKVIITSATIDPERFAAHFAAPDGTPAPIVEVSGRTFPVEMRYRPLSELVGEAVIDRDEVDGVCDAVAELLREGQGDILVFLSGEREIRDTADALKDRRLRGVEVLPLYARLSTAEQQRVFQPHSSRRVVLSTNVAETSLTVPGIHYVIDPGTARISRYSARTKVQRLPIEPISQASARQRAGRCGRTADGICIRLYSEEDFDARPLFTEPEILRTNLASVMLQMTALGLGDMAKFPFVERPDERAVRDGVALLEELGALELHGRSAQLRLTPIGRELAGIPVDPRMARMLVEANKLGVLAETLVIVAALSIQDVRERPADHQQAADEKHARFAVEGSDFLSYLALWNYLGEQRHSMSSNQFRKMCRTEFLHYLRIREWQDLRGQLRQIVRRLGWTVPDEVTRDPASHVAPVHQAILAGLLSHIGLREGESREFQGARNVKFMVFPGSKMAKKPPRWIMASELVETSRLWARDCGRIEPEWAEKLAGHLVKRQYSEPHWSIKRGAAMAWERVTLYGVPIVARRAVGYSGIEPGFSRELFIRHALVQGEWTTHHKFFAENRALLEDVAELEERARRRDLVVDDDALYAFYDERIPATVVTARHFDSWWKKKRRTDPELLTFTTEAVVNPEAAAVSARDFPDSWRQGDMTFPLTYQFEPGAADDGVTAHIPVALLAGTRNIGFDWSVPGLRADLAVALIKTLPKHLRRAVVPAPDMAARALAAVKARSEPITTALARELTRLSGARIQASDFVPAQLPGHLRMTFAAVGNGAAELGRSKDLAALKRSLEGRTQREVARATSGVERPPAREWTDATLGTLSASVTQSLGGQHVTGYPALSAEPGGVAVRVLATPAAQAASTRIGLRELLIEAAPIPAKTVTAGLSNRDRLALAANPDGSLEALVADCRAAAADSLVASLKTPVRAPRQFESFVSQVRGEYSRRVAIAIRDLVPLLAADQQLRALIERWPRGSVGAEAVEDVREQRASLVFPGFVADIGLRRLRQVPRYLSGAIVRLQSLPASLPRDQAGMDVLDRLYAEYQAALENLPDARRSSPKADEILWMIEELRVSLFAQSLGTSQPVSEKRISAAIAAL